MSILEEKLRNIIKIIDVQTKKINDNTRQIQQRRTDMNYMRSMIQMPHDLKILFKLKYNTNLIEDFDLLNDLKQKVQNMYHRVNTYIPVKHDTNHPWIHEYRMKAYNYNNQMIEIYEKCISENLAKYMEYKIKKGERIVLKNKDHDFIINHSSTIERLKEFIKESGSKELHSKQESIEKVSRLLFEMGLIDYEKKDKCYYVKDTEQYNRFMKDLVSIIKENSEKIHERLKCIRKKILYSDEFINTY
jgi:hypothetical protein